MIACQSPRSRGARNSYCLVSVKTRVTSIPDGEEPSLEAGIVVNVKPLDRATLQALPENLLGNLRKAVAAARDDEIIEIVGTIGDTEPDVANRLRRMADSFDYDGMRDLLGR